MIVGAMAKMADAINSILIPLSSQRSSHPQTTFEQQELLKLGDSYMNQKNLSPAMH